MSTINRAVKAGSGTPEYAPKTLILSAEVNLDFDTIYDDYNGSIDSANVAFHGLSYDRLVLTNSIVNADINNSAAIDGSKLADDTITPQQVATLGYGAGACVTSAAITTETTLATAAITTGGGPIFCLSNVSTSLLIVAGPDKTVTWRWKRDAVTFTTKIHTLSNTSPNVPIQVPISGPTTFDIGQPAGTYTYTLTVETDGIIFTPTASAGAIHIKEFIG